MRFLLDPDAGHNWERVETDVVVVGGGVAGLSAAIEAAQHCDVLVLTKAWLSDSNTEWAQGGVAAVMSERDSTANHTEDTVRVGCGLCDEPLVEQVVGEAPAAISRLLGWGAQFDRGQDGELRLGMEGGHSAERVVHAMGDRTGREIQRVLAEQARREPRIRILEHAFVLDLVTDSAQRVVGLLAHASGRNLAVSAGQVVLSTGGCGQVYRESTNPEVATGDGHAMMLRAGVRLSDMEFVQFHPTTLYIAGSSRILISEAARGEGAVLRDKDGVAFMDALHPRGSLAPRDLVSRAVLQRMVETEHTNVYLDLRHLSASHVRARFPRIDHVCTTFGLDITRDLVPVAPAAHYMIGGAVVDVDGRTSLEGLYAAGEVTASGLHGANRLASNSLLEGLVLGLRTGRVIAADPAPRRPWPREFAANSVVRRRDPEFNALDLLNSVKSLTWRHVGLVRTGAELEDAENRLETWRRAAAQIDAPTPRHWELLNLLDVARVIAAAARARDETRGVHSREDHPERDDQSWRVHLDVERGPDESIRLHRIAIDAQGRRLAAETKEVP